MLRYIYSLWVVFYSLDRQEFSVFVLLFEYKNELVGSEAVFQWVEKAQRLVNESIC